MKASRISSFFETYRKPLLIGGLIVILGIGITLNMSMISKSSGSSGENSVQDQETEDLSHADFDTITASYSGTAYEGEAFDESRVSVRAVLKDGTEIPISRFDWDGARSYGGITDYTIYTSYGDTTLTVDPVLIQSVRAAEGSYSSGNEFQGSIELLYPDGTIRTIRSSEVTYPEGNMMTSGLNAIPIDYEGSRHTLYVNAGGGNRITEARETCKEELQRSIYNSVTDRMFMTVTHVDGEASCYLAHILISEPSQLRVGTANNSYGTTTGFSAAASSFNWILGMGGSSSGSQDTASGCIIRNGQVISGGLTTGNEICLTDEGALFSPPSGITADELLAQNVTATLVTSAPLLIQDGQLYSEGSRDTDPQPSAAVGMVSPGEYYFLLSDTAGLTDAAMQQILSGAGCRYARPCTYGTAAQMYYKTIPVSASSDEAVQDFLYITE